MGLGACSPGTEEERICGLEQEFTDPDAKELQVRVPDRSVRIKECVATFSQLRKDMGMNDAQYAEYRKCRGAAKTMRASFECAVAIDQLIRPPSP